MQEITVSEIIRQPTHDKLVPGEPRHRIATAKWVPDWNHVTVTIATSVGTFTMQSIDDVLQVIDENKITIPRKVLEEILPTLMYNELAGKHNGLSR